MPPIALPAILDQRTVEAARDLLSEALAAGDVVVDAAGVERVNTVGLHLLLSAGETAREAGRRFVVSSPSAVVLDAISALGLGPRFSTWIEA